MTDIIDTCQNESRKNARSRAVLMRLASLFWKVGSWNRGRGWLASLSRLWWPP